MRVLTKAWEQFPDYFDIWWALATISLDRGDIDRARALANQLVESLHERTQEHQLLSMLNE